MRQNFCCLSHDNLRKYCKDLCHHFHHHLHKRIHFLSHFYEKGGVGTFDEIWDSVCGKSLGMKGMKFKPICLINTDGFYNGFVVQMDRSQKEGEDKEFFFFSLLIFLIL